MIETVVAIPFILDSEARAKRAHIMAGSDDAKEFLDLVNKAQEVARPKALYKQCFVEAKTAESVTVDGVTFTSRALRMSLDKAERLFAFVTTCGTEVDHIDIPHGDLLQGFWLDTIKAALLGISMRHLSRRLDHKYKLGQTATMQRSGSSLVALGY